MVDNCQLAILRMAVIYGILILVILLTLTVADAGDQVERVHAANRFVRQEGGPREK